MNDPIRILGKMNNHQLVLIIQDDIRILPCGPLSSISSAFDLIPEFETMVQARNIFELSKKGITRPSLSPFEHEVQALMLKYPDKGKLLEPLLPKPIPPDVILRIEGRWAIAEQAGTKHMGKTIKYLLLNEDEFSFSTYPAQGLLRMSIERK